MRISQKIKNLIIEAIQNSFGNDVDIYLFGSRVDDNKRGGDIDIAVDTSMHDTKFKKSKIAFLTYMLKYNFEFKIDIVRYNNKNKLFRSEIQNNSIKLSR